jgi:hypothetical protein
MPGFGIHHPYGLNALPPVTETEHSGTFSPRLSTTITAALVDGMTSRTTRKIAKLKRNSAFDTVPRWRDIEAYEISPTELFGAPKNTLCDDVYHLHFGLRHLLQESQRDTFDSEEVSGLTSLHWIVRLD